MARKKDTVLKPARDCVDRLLCAVQAALQEPAALQMTRTVKCKRKQDSPDGPTEQNWTEEAPTGAADIGKIKEYAAVLDSLIRMERDLYDLPNGSEAERRQLAKEKMELTKQKLAGADAQALEVHFSEEALAWSE